MNRRLSLRLSTWPRFPHKTRYFYKILRRVLLPEQFALISRVHDVVQASDGKFRLDIWIDNRTDDAYEVVRCLRAALPRRWHTRLHLPYSDRNVRSTGLRSLRRIRSLPQGLTVASWNIRTFHPKKASVLGFVQQNKVNVLALQETRCKVDSWAPRLKGFTVHSVPCNERGHVGLALAIQREVPSTLLEKHENWIICEIRTAQGIWLIVNIYFPCGQGINHRTIRDFELALHRYSSNISRARVIILGDFNRDPSLVDQLCWRWPVQISRLPTRSSPGTFHGFRPHFEPSAIDHILMGPMPREPPKVTVLRGWSDSDHWPILVRIPVALGEVLRPEPRKVCSRQLSESSKMHFLADNRWAVLAEQITEVTTVSAATDALLRVFNDVGQSVGGLREIGGPDERRRCMTHTCRRALRIRTRALRNYLSSGLVRDREEYDRAKCAAETALRESNKRAWAERVEELRHAVGTGNSKQAWAWMNRVLKPHREFIEGLPAIFDRHDVLQTSTEGKAEAWGDYYTALFDDPTGHSRDATWWAQYIPLDQLERVELVDPLAEPWSPGALTEFLDKLVNGKAPGVDKIPPEWFKWLRLRPILEGFEPPEGFPNHAVKALGLVLNLVCHNGIPDCWQRAELVSIFKYGDQRRAGNYRGIALIPVGLKILCSMVIERFNHTLTERNLLRREQAGFRRREECVGQIASLQEISTRRRTNGFSTYMAFIDFKKAYDMVPHEALFAKLRRAGFSGIFMEFLEGLYRRSTMQPRYTNRSIPVRRGLRQGCPMSPSLFNFFINDLFDPIDGSRPEGVTVPMLSGDTKCAGLFFADDVVLLADTPEGLKGSLNHLEQWCNRWEMDIGIAKCAVMLVSPLSIDPITVLRDEGPWLLRGQEILPVRKYRYLGFEFTDDLLSEAHMAACEQSAKGAFGRCYSFLRNRTIPLGLRAMAYKTLVLPILSWGCELLPLDRTITNRLSQLQNRQLRALVGQRASSRMGCPFAMGLDFNIPPFFIRASTSRVRLHQKAPLLRTWLHVLCREKCRLPVRGSRPWILLTDRWIHLKLRKYGSNGDLPLHQWLREQEWLNFVELSSTSDAVHKYIGNGFIQSRNYLVYGNFDLQSIKGFESIFKMRTGAFASGKRLALIGYIDQCYRTSCPFCELQVPETLEHLLLECSRWSETRSVIFRDILGIINGMSLATASVMLLGGEIRGENGTIEGPILVDGEPLTLITVVFLNTIMPIRSRLLAPLRLDLPPRVNAPRGTTVLENGTELTEPGGVPRRREF